MFIKLRELNNNKIETLSLDMQFSFSFFFSLFVNKRKITDSNLIIIVIYNNSRYKYKLALIKFNNQCIEINESEPFFLSLKSNNC